MVGRFAETVAVVHLRMALFCLASLVYSQGHQHGSTKRFLKSVSWEDVVEELDITDPGRLPIALYIRQLDDSHVDN